VTINPYSGQAVSIDNTAKIVVIEFGTVTPEDFFIITITTRVNNLGEPPGGTNNVTLTTSSLDEDLTNNVDGAVTRIVERDPEEFELPQTGFTPGINTNLPPQPLDQLYASYGNLVLEIPSLGVMMDIVGIPMTENGWDVSWLWDNAGYLDSTAFPTWPGNTALAGHVVLPDGNAGPFARLGELQWGDQIIIYAWGMKYIYEIRTVEIVAPHDMSVLEHEEYDWVTLITCKGYDETLDEYEKRLVARAVLTAVELVSENKGSGGGISFGILTPIDDFFLPY